MIKRFLTILSILLFGIPCFAIDVTFDGFVADEAHILTPTMVEKINNQAKDLQNRTGADVAVVTLNKKDLRFKQLSDVTLEIGRKHKIGSKDKNEGVVFALVPNGNSGNRTRIEVGYGLESVLTDGKCGRILDDYVMSYYDKKQYEKAVEQGFTAIVNELNKYYDNPEEYKKQVGIENRILLIIFILIIISGIIVAICDDGSSGGGYYGGGGFSSGGSFSSFGGGGGFGGGGCGR